MKLSRDRTSTIGWHVYRPIAALFVVLAALAADWPGFRGGAEQTATVKEALPDTLAEVWTFKAGSAVESTAAIVGGVVYVGSMDGKLFALDLANGKPKWQTEVGAIKAPVGAHGGKVFAGNDDGLFHCVDAAKGEVTWKFNAEAEVTSGIAFVGESVLFGCGDEWLHCLNRTDGKPTWKFQVAGGPVYGTPVIANGKTYAAGCDSALHQLDVATGKELRTAQLGGQVGASAAVAGRQLFVGTMTNNVLAVDLDIMSIKWTATKRQPFYSSVAVTDKLVIAGCRDRRVYAFERDTGKDVWSFQTGNRVDSSPVVAGQRVYVGSYDHHLYVLDVATGAELQKIRLDGQIIASPAVSNGRLVISTDKGTVYCLGKK